MKYPVGNMVIPYEVENLRFVNVPGVRQGMEDTVGIEGEVLSVPQVYFFFNFFPESMTAKACPGGQPILFLFIELNPYFS